MDADGGKNFAIGGQILAGLDVRGDLVFLVPTYTLETPVLEGRASISLAGAFGNMDVSADATLTGPHGNVLNPNPSDSLFGGSDLYPMAALRWNAGNHNYMAYVMGGVPVGSYEPGRLANIGTGHWSVDGGGGYTYFNPKSGREFSAVVGLHPQLRESGHRLPERGGRPTWTGAPPGSSLNTGTSAGGVRLTAAHG